MRCGPNQAFKLENGFSCMNGRRQIKLAYAARCVRFHLHSSWFPYLAAFFVEGGAVKLFSGGCLHDLSLWFRLVVRDKPAPIYLAGGHTALPNASICGLKTDLFPRRVLAKRQLFHLSVGHVHQPFRLVLLITAMHRKGNVGITCANEHTIPP